MTSDLKKETELEHLWETIFKFFYKLDFNNCLKELREFWKEQALLTQKQNDIKEEIEYWENIRKREGHIDDNSNGIKDRLQKLNKELK